jgi:hypothetical protein
VIIGSKCGIDHLKIGCGKIELNIASAPYKALRKKERAYDVGG